MDELPQVDVFRLTQIKHIEKSLADDTWQLGVGEERHLVDSLIFVIRLSNQILVKVLEVGDRNILFEVIVFQDFFVNQLNTVLVPLSAFHLIIISE